MSNRFTVAPGREFTYPADPISLRAVKDAGGVSKLSDEDRAKIKFKTVRAGQDCSDMPEPAKSIYLQREWIIPGAAPSKVFEVKPEIEEK